MEVEPSTWYSLQDTLPGTDPAHWRLTSRPCLCSNHHSTWAQLMDHHFSSKWQHFQFTVNWIGYIKKHGWQSKSLLLKLQRLFPVIKGILPKGPYLPCLPMADRALLAGYPHNQRLFKYTVPSWDDWHTMIVQLSYNHRVPCKCNIIVLSVSNCLPI